MKNRTTAWVVAVVALVATLGSAWACGPTRQKYAETIEINAPADTVWAVVKNYGDMTWHPAIAATSPISTLEVDKTTRTLRTAGGLELRDQLTRYRPNRRMIGFLTQTADPDFLPVKDYQSILTVKERDHRAIVEWRGAFVRADSRADPAPDRNDEAALRAVTTFQRDGLAALKAQIESRAGKGS